MQNWIATKVGQVVGKKLVQKRMLHFPYLFVYILFTLSSFCISALYECSLLYKYYFLNQVTFGYSPYNLYS